MNNKPTLGDFLKKTRKDRGLTLRDLSKKTGYSIAEFSRLENGKRSRPSPELLKSLATVLAVDYPYIAFLAGYTEEKQMEEPVTFFLKEEGTRKIIPLYDGAREMYQTDPECLNAYYNAIRRTPSEYLPILRDILTVFVNRFGTKDKK